jgi:hypothetical protein
VNVHGDGAHRMELAQPMGAAAAALGIEAKLVQ